MKFTPILDGEDRVNQRSMHRWFWRSMLLLSALCVGIAVVSVQQYLEYADLRSEHAALKLGTADLHACLESKRELKEKAATLQAQCAKMNGIKYRPKNPADVLNMLQDVSLDVSMQEIILKKKKLDLVLVAHDAKVMLAYADRLRAHALCARVDVASIELVGNRVKALLYVDLK